MRRKAIRSKILGSRCGCNFLPVAGPAYQVPDFDAAIAALEGERFRCVSPPAPAAAFGMRRIVFLLSDTGMLIELIEESAARGNSS